MSEPLDITVREVQKIADSLREPDEDVFPKILILTPWEVKILNADVRNEQQKTLLFRTALPDLCTRLKAHTVIHVSMAWIVKNRLTPAVVASLQRTEDGGMRSPDGLMPRNHPERQEVLTVAEVTAHSATTYMADVVRSTNMPPMFGEMEALPGAENYILRHAQRAMRGGL